MTDRDKAERAPERFTPVADEEGFVYCQRHPYGAFVRLDAYDALQAERDALREALEFYADRNHDGYDIDVTNYGLSTQGGPIIRDGGEIARAALHQEREG